MGPGLARGEAGRLGRQPIAHLVLSRFFAIRQNLRLSGRLLPVTARARLAALSGRVAITRGDIVCPRQEAVKTRDQLGGQNVHREGRLRLARADIHLRRAVNVRLLPPSSREALSRWP